MTLLYKKYKFLYCHIIFVQMTMKDIRFPVYDLVYEWKID